MSHFTYNRDVFAQGLSIDTIRVEQRLETAASMLSSTVVNYNQAEARIRDADIAQESANLVRLGILQQASAAVLSQANQQPALAIQLLRT